MKVSDEMYSEWYLFFEDLKFSSKVYFFYFGEKEYEKIFLFLKSLMGRLDCNPKDEFDKIRAEMSIQRTCKVQDTPDPLGKKRYIDTVLKHLEGKIGVSPSVELMKTLNLSERRILPE